MSELFVYRSEMPASAEVVYAWHARPDALTQLTPPWENARVHRAHWLDRTARLSSKDSTSRRSFLPNLDVRAHACDPGRMFRDVMVAGPFRRWEHTHLFIPDGPNNSWLEDRVDYEFPLGWVGKLIGGAYTRRRLSRMFVWRHRITAEAVAQQAPIANVGV